MDGFPLRAADSFLRDCSLAQCHHSLWFIATDSGWTPSIQLAIDPQQTLQDILKNVLRCGRPSGKSDLWSRKFLYKVLLWASCLGDLQSFWSSTGEQLFLNQFEALSMFSKSVFGISCLKKNMKNMVFANGIWISRVCLCEKSFCDR